MLLMCSAGYLQGSETGATGGLQRRRAGPFGVLLLKPETQAGLGTAGRVAARSQQLDTCTYSIVFLRCC